MKQFWVATVIFLVFALPARGQSGELPDSVITAYSAYTEAVQNGDLDAALAAARDAYRAGDRENIDPLTQATLAENYGFISGRAGQADVSYAAWRDAAEIGEDAEAPAVDSAWRWHNAAIAAFAREDYRDAARCAGRATALLDDLGDEELTASVFAGESYYLEAKFHSDLGRLRLSRAPAERAVELFELAGREPDAFLASAYYIWGLGSVVRERWEDAHFALHMARDIYGDVSPGSEAYHRSEALLGYARLASNERRSGAVTARLEAHPLHMERYPTTEPDEVDEADPGYVDAAPVSRRQPRYPRDAGMTATEGVVIIRFDVTETGSTDRIEILAEAPTGLFGESVERAVRDWEYTPAAQDGVPVRREGVMTHFYFSMRD